VNRHNSTQQHERTSSVGCRPKTWHIQLTMTGRVEMWMSWYGDDQADRAQTLWRQAV